MDSEKTPANNRQQKRLEAAEQVCRALRKSMACYGSQDYYMNVALDWLGVWMGKAPKSVKYADPTPRKRRKNQVR